MKIFEFSGFGNYSDSFGWDNGISYDVREEVSFAQAREYDQSNLDIDSFVVYGGILPESPVKGIYKYFFHQYGGSRTEYGWVIAESLEEAKKLLREEANKYPVVEYEREEE